MTLTQGHEAVGSFENSLARPMPRVPPSRMHIWQPSVSSTSLSRRMVG